MDITWRDRAERLESERVELDAERHALSISLRLMVNNLDASMTRVAELETVLGEVLKGTERAEYVTSFARWIATADAERWRATLKG